MTLLKGFPWTSLVALFFVCHTASSQIIGIHGQIEAKDSTAGLFSLTIKELEKGAAEGFPPVGERIEVEVFRGDQLVYAVGQIIRGKLSRNLASGGWRLEQVWPGDSGPWREMVAENLRLRRDTLLRGERVFRAVGETMPDFALFNQHGQLMRAQDFRGKALVLAFIFTRCTMPTMCPATTRRMGLLQQELLEAGLADKVNLAVITLDPEFDTPGVFYAYAEDRGLSHDNFFLLGGPTQAVEDLKKQLGILAEKDPQLIVNHTMRAILVNPLGQIIWQVPGSSWSVEQFFGKAKELFPESGAAMEPALKR